MLIALCTLFAQQWLCALLAAQMSAQKKLRRAWARTMQFDNEMDELYVGIIALRSEPLETFLGGGSRWPLPITSLNEARLLRELGISSSEKIAIKELSSVRVQGTFGLSDEQQ
eukprot:7260938-Prymnesium_polylepis.1